MGACTFFGGMSRDEQPVSMLTKVDLATGTITRVNASGVPPTPRTFHSAVAVGSSMYVFGGMSNHNVFSDMHRYCTKSNTWEEVAVAGRGLGRYGHVAAAVGSRIYSFGGNSEMGTCGDLRYLDTRRNPVRGPLPGWLRVDADGMPPTLMVGGAMCALDGRLYLFGGAGKRPEHGDVFNTMHVFCTARNLWVTPRCRGRMPRPRVHHQLVPIDSCIFIVAGQTTSGKFLDDVYVYNPRKRTYVECETEEMRMPARGGFAAGNLNGQLVVLGGQDDQGPIKDCWRLQLDVCGGADTAALSSSFGDEMGRLLESGSYADLRIFTEPDEGEPEEAGARKSVMAHRSVVCARSEFFANLLGPNYADASTRARCSVRPLIGSVAR
eukprot:TRINITY_DN9586_c0_g1_i1.p1 TRINITY_DN9586_c0_g1~~TRINITY_DN9586_c0_g1_i1.p1  ORF type:complete len:380 (+),score=53.08 TRINITY_DN9586_c0_g1_i1:17-1156(+)